MTEAGQELTFHAMYCNTSRFTVGDVAQVELTFDAKGKRRAERILFEITAESNGMTLQAAFEELKSLGLLHEWTLKVAKQKAEGLFGEVPAILSAEDAAALLSDYYDVGATSRAKKDGFLAHDWRFGQETDDIVAEFVAALRCAPSVVLVRSEGSIVTVRDGSKPEVAIDVEAGGV